MANHCEPPETETLATTIFELLTKLEYSDEVLVAVLVLQKCQ